MPRNSIGDEVRKRVMKKQSGRVGLLTDIEGVGEKTARKIQRSVTAGAGRKAGPEDVAELTADELADRVEGLGETKARKVIRESGGNPDVDETGGSGGSVEAGNIMEGLSEQRKKAVRKYEGFGTDVDRAFEAVQENVESQRSNIPSKARKQSDVPDLEESELLRLGRAAFAVREASKAGQYDDDVESPVSEEEQERAVEAWLTAAEGLERKGYDRDEAEKQLRVFGDLEESPTFESDLLASTTDRTDDVPGEVREVYREGWDQTTEGGGLGDSDLSLSEFSDMVAEKREEMGGLPDPTAAAGMVLEDLGNGPDPDADGEPEGSVDSRDLTELPGIGPKTADTLREAGITTPSDLVERYQDRPYEFKDTRSSPGPDALSNKRVREAVREEAVERFVGEEGGTFYDPVTGVTVTAENRKAVETFAGMEFGDFAPVEGTDRLSAGKSLLSIASSVNAGSLVGTLSRGDDVTDDDMIPVRREDVEVTERTFGPDERDEDQERAVSQLEAALDVAGNVYQADQETIRKANVAKAKASDMGRGIGVATQYTKKVSPEEARRSYKHKDDPPDVVEESIAVTAREFAAAQRRQDQRSRMARRVDANRKAPVVEDFEKWTRNPNHFDFPGVDTPVGATEAFAGDAGERILSFGEELRGTDPNVQARVFGDLAPSDDPGLLGFDPDDLDLGAREVIGGPGGV